jgi:hypothetical protein
MFMNEDVDIHENVTYLYKHMFMFILCPVHVHIYVHVDVHVGIHVYVNEHVLVQYITTSCLQAHIRICACSYSVHFHVYVRGIYI